MDDIKQEAKEFAEFIKLELAQALKAEMTGNMSWSGEYIKKPTKTYRNQHTSELDIEKHKKID